MLIGKKIKELRKAKKISLTQLAQMTGIQIATLSRIEHLRMSGTVDSHNKIAQALDIDLAQLYSHVIKEDSAIEIKTLEPQNIFVHNDKASYEILTNKVLNKKMMPVLLTLAPQGDTPLEELPVGSERFIYILEGSLEVNIDDKKYLLTKNNTLYIDASLKHSFTNTGNTTVKLISVVTPVSL